MEYISVIVAAAAAFMLGAAWYSLLSKPWINASGIKCDENGNPIGGRMITPFVMSGIAMLLVSGMMRHTFEMAAIDTMDKGLISGLGVGLFFISPWIMINNAYGMRPFKLTLIDGGYAVTGCGLIGLILTAM